MYPVIGIYIFHEAEKLFENRENKYVEIRREWRGGSEIFYAEETLPKQVGLEKKQNVEI